MTRERLVGTACALASVLLFSSFTLASRLGFSSALTLPDLAFLRFGLGGLLLLPVLLRHGVRRLAWREAVTLAFLGGLGFALLAYAGFRLAPAAHGAVLFHGTLPLTTHLVERAIEPRLRVPRRTVSAIVIGAGIALVAWDSLAVASARQLLGDGLLLMASFWWSAYGVTLTTLAAIPLLGEVPTPATLAGLGVVTLGMWIALSDRAHPCSSSLVATAHTGPASRD